MAIDSFSFRSEEIDQFIDFYLLQAGEIYLILIDLMEHLLDFRSASAIGAFGKLRNQQPVTEARCHAIFQEIALPLKLAAEKIEHIANAADQQLLKDAIIYCKKSIQQRLTELQKENDPLWHYYLAEKKSLKAMLLPTIDAT